MIDDLLKILNEAYPGVDATMGTPELLSALGAWSDQRTGITLKALLVVAQTNSKEMMNQIAMRITDLEGKVNLFDVPEPDWMKPKCTCGKNHHEYNEMNGCDYKRNPNEQFSPADLAKQIRGIALTNGYSQTDQEEAAKQIDGLIQEGKQDIVQLIIGALEMNPAPLLPRNEVLQVLRDFEALPNRDEIEVQRGPMPDE